MKARDIIERNINLKIILFSFLNLFVIFRIDFLVLPYYLYFLAILGVAIAVFKFGFLKDAGMTNIVLCYVILVVLAVLSLLINGSTDYSYISLLIAIIYKMFLAATSIYVFKLIFGEKATLDNFLYSYVISCALLVLSSIVLILFSSFSDFWIGTVVPRNKLLDEGYFARKSIIGYTGFDELAVFCISYYFCAWLIANKFNRDKKVKSLFLIYIILVLGGLIYGRTSIITAAFSFILLFILVKNKKKMIKYMSLLAISLLMIVFILYKLSQKNALLENWLGWALEPINALLTGGSVGSMNSLKNMIVLPDILTSIFGDGQYITSDGYYMHTDIGYLRAIYYFGFIGLIAIYTMLFVTIRRINQIKQQKSVSLMLYFILLNIFVYELKGAMWDGAFAYLFMIYFVVSEERKSKNKKLPVVEINKVYTQMKGDRV